jgi:hypothetical protein
VKILHLAPVVKVLYDGKQKYSDLLYEGDKLIECKVDLEAKKSRDKLIAKLDEVDGLMRELMKERIERNGNGHQNDSRWLSCLMRCRADVQSAITQLLGSYE